MRAGLHTLAAALVAIGAATPAFAQTATNALAVSVVVTRTCAVETTSGSSTGARVTLACSRGTTPALVGLTTLTPMPMPAAAAPLGSTPNPAAAPSSQVATTAARQVVPMQTVTVLATAAPVDGSGRATDRDRLVTINF